MTKPTIMNIAALITLLSEIRKEISNAKTPEQLAGIIGRLQALMAGQAKGIRQEWVSSGLDEKSFDNKLMPRTKVVLNKQKEPSRSNYYWLNQ